MTELLKFITTGRLCYSMAVQYAAYLKIELIFFCSIKQYLYSDVFISIRTTVYNSYSIKNYICITVVLAERIQLKIQ
jgi:hypothetical protein